MDAGARTPAARPAITERAMPPYESLPYRPCVGLAVLNRDGRVFIGRRLEGPEHIDAAGPDWLPARLMPTIIGAVSAICSGSPRRPVSRRSDSPTA